MKKLYQVLIILDDYADSPQLHKRSRAGEHAISLLLEAAQPARAGRRPAAKGQAAQDLRAGDPGTLQLPLRVLPQAKESIHRLMPRLRVRVDSLWGRKVRNGKASSCGSTGILIEGCLPSIAFLPACLTLAQVSSCGRGVPSVFFDRHFRPIHRLMPSGRSYRTLRHFARESIYNQNTRRIATQGVAKVQHPSDTKS